MRGNRAALALQDRIWNLHSTLGYADPNGSEIEDRSEAALGHAAYFLAAWRDIVADASLKAELEAA